MAKKWISFGIILFLINGLIFLYYQNTVKVTGGAYVYPLDDTYIHLAIAKNVAFYNNWGVVHDEFSSSSSAPLYTLILSVLIRLFGDNSLYPLFVNLFFGNLFIVALRFFFNKNIPFLIYILFLCTPVLIHIQILSGMEHTLHICMIITDFMVFSKLLKDEFRDKKYNILFLAVTALLCLTRYESMFFIFSIIIVLTLHKQYKLSLLTFIVGFMPVVLFGIWSISNHGFFFPNSLLVKGDIAQSGNILKVILHYGVKLYRNIFRASIFIVPIAVMISILLLDLINRKEHHFYRFIIIAKKYSLVFITCLTILLHGFFAGFGWLYRYEAYLLALLYLTFLVFITEHIGIIKQCFKAIPILVISYTSAFLLLCMLFDGMVVRFYGSNKTISQAGKNIYDQQIQMGEFLHAYYNEAKVMANDIGAITYYTKIHLLDLVGLGSNVIIQDKLNARGGGEGGVLFVKEYPFNQYTLILIYDSWFGINNKDDYERLGWIKAAELQIKNNVVCGDDKVSFYTSDASMFDELKNNLFHFREKIPEGVTITIFEEAQ